MKRLATLSVAGALVLAGCGGSGEDSALGPGSFAEQASHIHGLGVNPADGSLFIATHAGLYRSSTGSTSAVAVGESVQDTMGFSVAGQNHFVGSGHPGAGQDGPPMLGLIESRNGGETWQEVSLGGEADFHVLRYADDRIYGFNGLTGLLMVSSDGGESWQTHSPPTGLLDLAVDPRDPDHVIAVSDLGLIESTDQGKTWERQSEEIGYLAWPDADHLYLFDGDAGVSVSNDGGESFRKVGKLPDVPAAVSTASSQELYAALHDGEVLVSRDGGTAWTKRVEP